MKKLELKEMEHLLAGANQANNKLDLMPEGGNGGVGTNCAFSVAGALIFGTGGIIAAATGGVGGIAFAMAGSYFGWGMAAYSCS